MIRRIAVVIMVVALLMGQASAAPSVSPHYRLDPNVADTFGGQTGSSDYQLTDAGGEAAIGSSSSNSYQLGAGYVAQLAQSIQLSIMPSGVAAYFPLDTGQGTQVYDVGASNNQGTLANGSTWTSGKLGGALMLDGSNQYAAIPSVSSLSPSGDMTLTAWVNLSDYSVQHEIICKRVADGSTNTTYELRVQQTSGQLQFLSYDSSLKTITGTTPVPTGGWAQVAVVKQGGSARLYLNGTAISSPVSIGTPTTNNSDLMLGADNDLTHFLKGSLDEVRIYNRALSSAELAADIAAVNAGTQSAQAIPAVLPGISQTTTSDAVVRTDAAGYDLAIAENHNLLHTDGTTTIPSIGGTIAAPVAWSEGTTKGLGFTLTAGNNLESAWGGSPNYNYAAIPTVSTVFHSRSSFTGGAPDDTTMQYRLDTASGQKSGSYSNTVTISATLKP